MKVKNLIVGMEFNRNESRVCYYENSEQDAVSAEVRVGSDRSSFPTLLCRMPDSGNWHFGLEAEYFIRQKNGTAVEKLYDLCRDGSSLELDGQKYEADELLAVFLEQSLTLLGVKDIGAQVDGLMLTVPSLSRSFVRTIRKAFARLDLAPGRARLQDFRESFYYHTLYQRQELWGRQVALFCFEEDAVSFSRLVLNAGARPVTARVLEGERAELPLSALERDAEFRKMAERCLGDEIFSSVFLVGQTFNRSWAKTSIQTLCRKQRKVFSENNLFAKGACYAIREKVDQRVLKGYMYLGNDMVTYDLGMELLINGTEAYVPLASAGMNWYEAGRTCEILLDGSKNLEFLVTRMQDGIRRRYSMELVDLPERPAKASRVRLQAEFDAPDRCRIRVEDLGFGELFPTSGKVWQEVLEG